MQAASNIVPAQVLFLQPRTSRAETALVFIFLKLLFPFPISTPAFVLLHEISSFPSNSRGLGFPGERVVACGTLLFFFFFFFSSSSSLLSFEHFPLWNCYRKLLGNVFSGMINKGEEAPPPHENGRQRFLRGDFDVDFCAGW